MYMLKEEAFCYAASRRCVSARLRARSRDMFGGQQRIDVRRTHHCSIIYKSLMIALDRFDVVEGVHHDAERFLDAARRGVSEPVDPLQTRAISQMKAGDRISRLLARGVARQIASTTPHDHRLQPSTPTRS